MGDMGEIFNGLRKIRQEKRSCNKEQSTELLKQSGINFKSHNAGVHLEILAGNRVIDFWPSTGLWMVRGGSKYKHRGVRKLIEYIEKQ